jgi:hypothetical protein
MRFDQHKIKSIVPEFKPAIPIGSASKSDRHYRSIPNCRLWTKRNLRRFQASIDRPATAGTAR